MDELSTALALEDTPVIDIGDGNTIPEATNQGELDSKTHLYTMAFQSLAQEGQQPAAEHIRNQLAVGNESQLRIDLNDMARQRDYKNLEDYVQQYSYSPDYDRETARALLKTMNDLYNSPVDYERVIADDDLHVEKMAAEGINQLSYEDPVLDVIMKTKTTDAKQAYLDEVAFANFADRKLVELADDTFSWGGTPGDALAMLIPGYYWGVSQGRFSSMENFLDEGYFNEEKGDGWANLLTGSNFKAANEWFYSLPIEERAAKWNEFLAMAKDNGLIPSTDTPLGRVGENKLATLMSAQYLLAGIGPGERLMEDAGTVLDFLPYGVLLSRGARGLKVLTHLVGNREHVLSILQGRARSLDAAEVLRKKSQFDTLAELTPQGIEPLDELLPNMSSKAAYDTALRREAMNVYFDQNKGDRLTDEAKLLATENVKDDILNEMSLQPPEYSLFTQMEASSFPRTKEELLGKTSLAPQAYRAYRDTAVMQRENYLRKSMAAGQAVVDYDPATNLYKYRMWFGDPSEPTNAFISKAAAIEHAENTFGFKDYQVVPDGSGWFISVDRALDEQLNGPVDELGNVFKANKFKIGENGLVEGQRSDNMFTNWVAGAKFTLNKETNILREMSEDTKRLFAQTIEESSRPLNSLRGRSRQRMSSWLVELYTRDANDWPSLDQMKAFYEQRGWKYTDKAESAYLAYRDVNDFLYLVENNRTISELSAGGWKHVNYANKKIIGKPHKLEAVRGSVYDPVNDKRYPAGTFNPDTFLGTVKGMPEDFTLIQVPNSNIKAFLPEAVKKGVIAPRAQYVVIHKSEVGIENIKGMLHEYRAGGRIQYEGNFALKQNIVERTLGDNGLVKAADYIGTRTHHVVGTKTEAERFAAKYNKVIDAWLEREAGTVSDHDFKRILQENLPLSYKEWTKAVKEGDIELTRMQVVENYGNTAPEPGDVGSQIRTMFGGDPNSASVSFLLDDNSSFYTRKRGGKRLRDPRDMRKFADFIDPIVSLSQVVNNVESKAGWDNYRRALMAKWVSTFDNLIDYSKLEGPKDIYRAFNEGVLKTGIDPRLAGQAERLRQSYKQLTMPRISATSKGYQASMNRIAALVDHKGWEGSAAFMYKLAKKDPVAFLKATNYVRRLGLWNPDQIVVQSQTMNIAMSIHPVYGSKALAPLMASHIIRHADNDAGIIKTIAKNQKSMTEQQFIDFYKRFRASGKMQLGSALAELDPAASLSKGFGSKFFKSNTSLVMAVEKNNSMYAWVVSYLKWLDENPAGIWNNKAAGEVSTYANTLAGNMTDTARARWQEGTLGTITQFQSYSARILELTGDTELSLIQRSRMVGYQWLLYGRDSWIPARVGTILENNMRQPEEGELYQPKTLFEMMLWDGAIDTMMKQIGADTDFGSRAGALAHGIWLTEMIAGAANLMTDQELAERGIVENLTGPSKDYVDAASALIKKVIYRGATELGKPRYYTEDMARELLELTSMSSKTAKIVRAIESGKYITGSGAEYGDISVPEIFALAAGFPLEAATKTYEQSQYNEWKKSYIDAAGKEYNDMFKKWVLALNEDNLDDMKYYEHQMHLITDGLPILLKGQIEKKGRRMDYRDRAWLESMEALKTDGISANPTANDLLNIHLIKKYGDDK